MATKTYALSDEEVHNLILCTWQLQMQGWLHPDVAVGLRESLGYQEREQDPAELAEVKNNGGFQPIDKGPY